MTPASETAGHFGLRLFARSAGILSISSLAGFVRAVITAKLFALALGPSALGVLAQLLNFSAFVSSVIPLGLTTGVVKMVAERSSDERATGIVAWSAAAVALASGVAASLLLLPFAGPLSTALTGSTAYAPLVILIVLSFPLYNLSGTLAYVLQGLGDIPRLTWANTINAAASIAVLIPATALYGLAGAILAVLVTSLIQLAIFGVALWRAYAARAWGALRSELDPDVMRTLLRYGGIVLLGGAISWGCLLAVRTLTVRRLGEYENGLYQVAYGLSNQYVTIFMTWMAAYVFPRLAAERDHGRLHSLLNSGLRANLALMVPILVLAAALPRLLIPIFYSAAFLPAGPLIPAQVFGDYARVVGWSFGVSLFALGRTRGHLAVVATQSLLWVGLSAALLPGLRLQGVAVAYGLSLLAYPVLSFAMVGGWFGAGPDRRSIYLCGLGLGCLGAAALVPNGAGVVLAPVLPLAVVMLNRRDARARPAP